MKQQQDKFSINQSTSVDREGDRDNKTTPGVGLHEKDGAVVPTLKLMEFQKEQRPPLAGNWTQVLTVWGNLWNL